MDISEKSVKDMLKNAKENIPTQMINPIKDVNLFSILGVEHKEVSAHSAFLYYVFNPFYFFGKDNKVEVDDRNIKELLKEKLFKKLKEQNPNAIYPKEPRNIYLGREVSFSYGRLDFLIVYSDDNGEKEDAIVIELKIWAGEQQHQLKRYKEYLSDNGYSENNIFFLTPGEREAKTADNVINITLKDDIIPILKSICDIREYSIPYVNAIKQYIDTVNRITETGAEKMSDEYKKIIGSKEDVIAAGKLIEYRDAALTDILIGFMRTIKDKFDSKLKENYSSAVESKNMVFLDYHDKEEYLRLYYKNGRSCYPAIMLKLKKEWLKEDFTKLLDSKGDSDYYPCFYVEIDYNLYAGITIKKGDGEPEYFDISTVKDELKKQFEANNTTNWWVDYDYILENNNRIDFKRYDDRTQGVLRLLNENSLTLLDNKVDDIVEAIFNVFKNMIGKFFDSDKIDGAK